MHLALEEAERAADLGEVPVGAVLVCNGEVLASSHNLCETLHDATAHAECLAISEAGKRLGRWRLSDCTLYATLEPCPMCTSAAIHARIGRIVYGARDARAGACGSVIDLPSYPLECTPDCIGGVLEEECAALLRRFFKKMRE